MEPSAKRRCAATTTGLGIVVAWTLVLGLSDHQRHFCVPDYEPLPEGLILTRGWIGVLMCGNTFGFVIGPPEWWVVLAGCAAVATILFGWHIGLCGRRRAAVLHAMLVAAYVLIVLGKAGFGSLP